jgi:hypothetical protein
MSLQRIDCDQREKHLLPAKRSMLQREYKVVDVIRWRVPKNKYASILDVGRGDESFLRRLDEMLCPARDYEGAHYSECKLKETQAFPFEFRRCNPGGGISWLGNSFDMAYPSEVIEQIYNPDQMLEECRLKYDGYVSSRRTLDRRGPR